MNKIENNMTHETRINKVQSYYKPHNTVFSHITKFSSPQKYEITRGIEILLGKIV
jgi:hypothetical protein